MTNRVQFLLDADNKVSRQLSQLRGDFDHLGKGAASSFLVGKIGADVLEGAVRKVSGTVESFLSDSVNAYREQEVATARLTQSLQQNVAGWDGNTEAIQRATEAGIALGFTDTETTNAMSLLVGATHDVSKALEILAVAQDLARFKGISLSDAVEALTRVEGGSFRILKSLGINLKAGATEAEALAAVLKVTGDQAQKFAATDLGRTDAALAKVEQSQEKFGRGLSHLEADILPAVADGVEKVASVVDDLTTSLDTGSSATDKIAAQQDFWHNGLVQALIPGAHAAAAAVDGISKSQLEMATTTEAANRAVFGSVDTMNKYGEAVVGAAKDIGDTAIKAFEGGRTGWQLAGKQIPLAIALGIEEGEKAAADSMTHLVELMKHPVSRARREAILEGRLTGKLLADGLKSSDPLVRQAAEQYRLDTEAQLDKLRREAPGYGKRTAKAYADGLESGVGYVQKAVSALLGPAQAQMKASSPPGPESPLHEIDKWGLKTGQAWADGLAKGVGSANDFGLGAIAPSFGGGGGSGWGGGGMPLIGAINVDARGSSDPGAVEAAAQRGVQAAADHVALALRDQTYRAVAGRTRP